MDTWREEFEKRQNEIQNFEFVEGKQVSFDNGQHWVTATVVGVVDENVFLRYDTGKVIDFTKNELRYLM